MTQKGDGSQEKLFATLQKARDEARKSEHENAVAYVRGVTYFLKEPLELSVEDSGITFCNYPGKKLN